MRPFRQYGIRCLSSIGLISPKQVVGACRPLRLALPTFLFDGLVINNQHLPKSCRLLRPFFMVVLSDWGGLAILVHLHRVVVEVRWWLADEEFAEGSPLQNLSPVDYTGCSMLWLAVGVKKKEKGGAKQTPERDPQVTGQGIRAGGKMHRGGWRRFS